MESDEDSRSSNSSESSNSSSNGPASPVAEFNDPDKSSNAVNYLDGTNSASPKKDETNENTDGHQIKFKSVRAKKKFI
jgi:hypothetical protein